MRNIVKQVIREAEELDKQKFFRGEENTQRAILPASIIRFVKSREKVSDGEYSICFRSISEGSGWDNFIVRNVKWVLDRIPKASYWELTTGWNSSLVENLIAWGGNGGYWSAKLLSIEDEIEEEKQNDSAFSQSRIDHLNKIAEKIRSKKIN